MAKQKRNIVILTRLKKWLDGLRISVSGGLMQAQKKSIDSIQKMMIPHKIKIILSFFWRSLGSSHFQNLLSILTLGVTVYLTLFVFEYTKQQDDSVVKVTFEAHPMVIIPPDVSFEDYGSNEFQWDIYIELLNTGPMDIASSDLFITLTPNSVNHLIGFDQKDFEAMVRFPNWPDPAPTPWASEQGYYIVPIKDFKTGGSFKIRMVFSVNAKTHFELLNKWQALGLIEVRDPRGGGYYYDDSQINREKYLDIVSTFIEVTSLNGQNVYVTGDRLRSQSR